MQVSNDTTISKVISEVIAPSYRAAAVRDEVSTRYNNPYPTHDPFLPWIVRDHLFVVVEEAQRLAEIKGANLEYCYVGALLHDVADPWYNRDEYKDHDALTRSLAGEILQKAGFTAREIILIVEDMIRFHGCRGTERPSSLEGKCLATADALAHFKSALYLYAARTLCDQSFEKFTSWMKGKVERDFYSKIAWDEERESIRPQYEALKLMISRW